MIAQRMAGQEQSVSKIATDDYTKDGRPGQSEIHV